jgi:DNA-binding FadR family transcriptional regulator
VDTEAAPQSRLPPERVLAERFGVSRGLLRRGLAALESEGRIWRHVGQGTFVGQRPPAEPQALRFITRQTSPAEVMEVRLLVEPQMAGLAAIRWGQGDLDRIRSCLGRSESARNLSEFEFWDGQLHAAIAAAARNSLLSAVFDGINAIREERIWGQLKQASFTPTRRGGYMHEHRAIVDAIADRNAEASTRVMREHLERIRQHMFG